MPLLQLAPRGRWHHQSHLQGVQAILTLCDRDERFRLPEADALNNDLLSNTDGKIITQGSLHQVALLSIMTEQSRWDLVLKASAKALEARHVNFRYISIGEKVSIPRGASEIQVIKSPDMLPDHHSSLQTARPRLERPTLTTEDFLPANAVAVIGMACRYPDADSTEDFWGLISEAQCVIKEFPEHRFKPSDLVREPRGPFWGGYLRHLDEFDHRFFGISGREANSMDPQQRLCLQVAYEAMESAGYFGLRSDAFNRDIGCYIGSANDDYCDNVASHPVSAFSLPGTLRSFISGRVSHHFGWTGPSMVLDTACSAAAVAIHTACRVSLRSSHTTLLC